MRRGGEAGEVADSETLRIDRWLWATRWFKTRALAAEAVSGGRVHLNGQRVKPARAVRGGDQLEISLEGCGRVIEVLDVPLRRGPASEARRCYRESEASVARFAAWQEARRLQALSVVRPAARPDKKQRRDLMALARQYGRR
jgi:ribosome-associated heat shock protein Hsp15